MLCLEMPSLAAQEDAAGTSWILPAGCILILNSAHAMCPLHKVDVKRDLWGQAKFGKRDIKGGKLTVETGAPLSRHQGWRNSTGTGNEAVSIERPACP